MSVRRLALLALGVALLGYLVVEVGPATLFDSFRTVSWGFMVIVWFPTAPIMLLDTLGWRYAFRHDLAPFPTLVAARLAGEAFNVTTPMASMGGEPVKAYLLRPRVPLGEGLASVIVAKTTLALAQGLFLLAGIALALTTVPATTPLLWGMAGLGAYLAVSSAVFILMQRTGFFLRASTLLRRLGLSWGGRRPEDFHRLDVALATFYREHRGRLALSILFHFAGWVAGTLEVYLILHFMGISVSLTTALVIEAFTTAIRAAAFVVPAALGAQEGGSMAIFAALNLGAGVGLSVSLVRRVRELAWVAVGLATLSAFNRTPDVG